MNNYIEDHDLNSFSLKNEKRKNKANDCFLHEWSTAIHGRPLIRNKTLFMIKWMIKAYN